MGDIDKPALWPPRFAMGCRPPDMRSSECDVVSPGGKTAHESRTLAFEAGWREFDGRGCCPKCADLVHPGRRPDDMKGIIH